MRQRTMISAHKVAGLLIAATAVLTGCGSSKTASVVPSPTLQVGLSSPPPAGPVNTYEGAQSPGAWSFALDDTSNSFSYQAVTYPSAAVSGNVTNAGGFKQLGTAGYALEVQGRAAIIRPGDSTTPPVFAVPQSACYAITGRLRFQYIGMQTGPDGSVGASGPTLGYGSVVASTDSTGKAWQFLDLQGNIVSGPGSFTGTCNATNSNAAIALTGQTLLDNLWPPDGTNQAAPTPGTQSSLWIGPSGFFVADQSDPTTSSPTGASVAGVAEPAAAINTTDLESQQYLGFLYEPATIPYGGVTASPVVTSPIAFGQVSSTVGTMTGGAYPNDDITQTPNSDIQVSLSTQDTTYNGLYLSASVTVLDPQQNCANYTGSGERATSGINALGYFTCTFAGVAVAGNPEGKYAVFVSTYNWATQLGGAPMQMYLFQQ